MTLTKMGYSVEELIEDYLAEESKNEEELRFKVEIKALIYDIKEQNSNKSYIKSGEGIDEIIYNYVIEWAMWGMVLLDERIGYPQSCVYSGFCIQISNTLLSIYKLVKDGLDYQAYCLIRVLLEMGMTFMAILLDDSLWNRYFETRDENKEREIWSKHLRYNRVEKTVLEYCKENAEKVFKENPEAQKIFSDMYHELSRFEHSSYINVVGFARAGMENERAEINIHGNKVTRVKMVLSEVFTVMVVLTPMFLRILLEKNILSDIRKSEEFTLGGLYNHAIALHLMTENLAHVYYDHYEKEFDKL